MARAKLSEELKKALMVLNSKEKDKLIFRLLPRDQKLVHQLEYKLLEESSTQEERRDVVEENIIVHFSKYPASYYSPAYLLKDIKKLSAIISYHTAVTGDKFGEIKLNLLLLIYSLTPNATLLEREGKWAFEKLGEYIVKRIDKLSKLIPKIHEDLHLEFEEDLSKINSLFKNLPLLQEIANQLDISLDIVTS